MSTLGHVSRERFREDSISQSRVAGSINLAFYWYPCYWKFLQQSKSKRISTCLRVKRTSIRRSWWGGIPSKKPSFQSYNFPVDMHSITFSRYWLSVMQHHHILMQELENVVAWGESEVHHLVSIMHAAASLKAVLPFDFVNTSGQKPCTLHTHFTLSYWALDTLLLTLSITNSSNHIACIIMCYNHYS